MDSNFSLSRALRIAAMDIYKWIINPRMITLAAMIVFVWNFAVIPLMEISREMNSPLNFIEPFIAVYNSRVLCLVTPAVYLFLVSDHPRLDRNGIFVLYRVNKKEWVTGQLIFFMFTAFSYNLIIFLGSLIPNCINSFVANGWSEVITKYGTLFPEKSSSFAARLITEELFNQVSPYMAAAASFALNFLYMLLLSMILLLFHVLELRKIGLPIAISVVGIGSALGIFKSWGMWLFPMPHTMISLHYTKYLKEPIMSVTKSVVYFILVILVFFLIGSFRVKHTDFLYIDDNE